MSIPASDIVQITPSVISGGGNSLALNGLYLTKDVAIPIGTVRTFTSASAVSSFFGPSSNEASLAATYFQGRNGGTKLPAQLLMAQYPETAVAAYLRSGSLSSMTLAQLQALSGTIIINVNGVVNTSASINLAGATSFSNAAALIQAGFTTPNFTVTYDSIRAGFVFTSSTTGVASTIAYATGTLSASLLLTLATGAVLSQGADAAVPATFMNALILVALNWGTFSTTWKPASNATMTGFSSWANSQNNRFAYVLWDTATAAKTTPDTTTALSSIITSGYSGTIGIYCDATIDPLGQAAAFAMGMAASINFARTNGRITFFGKYLSGVPVSVSDKTTSDSLKANGYNFIGVWATGNDTNTGFAPGSITGAYKFADEFLNQVYLNSQLQLALMNLLFNMNSIPYDATGNTYIASACQDPINGHINFGGIVPGVALSASQIAQVNSAAGQSIDNVLSTRGWYLLVGTATAQVRAARGTPPITLWYMDGGSVQSINLASILIQ